MKDLPVRLRTREHVHGQALFPTKASAQQQQPSPSIPHGTATTSYLLKILQQSCELQLGSFLAWGNARHIARYTRCKRPLSGTAERCPRPFSARTQTLTLCCSPSVACGLRSLSDAKGKALWRQVTAEWLYAE